MRMTFRNRLDSDNPPTPEVTGVWVNVTPGDANVSGSGNNFGASGVPIVDPTNAARMWAGFDVSGVWWSNDYGLTWTKRNTNGDKVEAGKIWGMAINCTGTKIYACSGGGLTYYQSVLRSDDGGVTFNEVKSNMGWEAYAYHCSPTDEHRLIATSHYDSNNDNVYESTDDGVNWTAYSSGSGGASGYAYYGLTHDTIIYVTDGDLPAANRTKRATRSGGSFGTFTATDDQSHYHGSHQLYVDRTNGLIWNPGPEGLNVSDDDGQTWDFVSNIDAASVIRAGSQMVAGRAYATQGGFDPRIQYATYPPATSWVEQADPSGMNNGPRAMCTTTNRSGQKVVVACCWVSGLWRIVFNS